MSLFHRTTSSLIIVIALFLPVMAIADEPENYEKDAGQAESTPPLIPHRIKDTSDGTYCLECHGSGRKGAPVTPHPERLTCTGCHILGEIPNKKLRKKGTGKK